MSRPPSAGTRPGADVVVSDLHKSFGPNPVLAGIDLTVPPGSFTAILGPSGSGKTTLLRIIAGFERPDRGSVAAGGVLLDGGRDDGRANPQHVPPERRQIGYVSQEGSLFPHLTAERNVAFGLPRSKRRGPKAREMLDAVGLGGFAKRYPNELSGGQQQRVALARALAVEPRIVLLDEPFASLDETLRASVRADVQALLRSAGATTILVTHDQDEALSMADLVAVIRSGTIAQMAPPYELYAHPVDADLARFVGDANLIDGVMDGDSVDTAFGHLEVRPGSRLARRGRAQVLVRPEQINLAAGEPGGGGVSGRVVSRGFHGHDAVVNVRPDRSDTLPETILVRVLGEQHLPTDDVVWMTIRGPVGVWVDTE